MTGRAGPANLVLLRTCAAPSPGIERCRVRLHVQEAHDVLPSVRLFRGFCSRSCPPELAPLAASAAAELPPVLPNDNRRAAGAVAGDTLSLKLRAAEGMWRPEGDAGPALRIEAFGEEGDALRAPAPLIRVRAGTTIVVDDSQRARSDAHSARACALATVKPCAPIEVPRPGRREVRFTLGRAGTYHYWATTTGMPLPFRGASDTQLSGALVVDPAPRLTPEADRVLVITDWTSLTRDELKGIASADDPGVEFVRINPRLTFLINGLSWPATERLTYRVGEKVRWRVINLSSQRHPMHMHGFYYEVDSLGDGVRDTAYPEGQQTTRRHATDAARLDDGDDVDAGARRQLAVPLPHHASRVARAAAHRSRRLTRRPSRDA